MTNSRLPFIIIVKQYKKIIILNINETLSWLLEFCVVSRQLYGCLCFIGLSYYYILFFRLCTTGHLKQKDKEKKNKIYKRFHDPRYNSLYENGGELPTKSLSFVKFGYYPPLTTFFLYLNKGHTDFVYLTFFLVLFLIEDFLLISLIHLYHFESIHSLSLPPSLSSSILCLFICTLRNCSNPTWTCRHWESQKYRTQHD